MMVRNRSVVSLLVLVSVVTVRVRAYQVSANSGSARCEEAGLCVECRGFHQPWLEFSEPHSAYHCFTSCQAYNFSYVDILGNFPHLSYTSIFTQYTFKINPRENCARYIFRTIGIR